MAINVTEKININSSRNTIADYMFNPQNDPEWIGGIVEVKDISSLPIGEGSEVHRIAHFMGKDVDYILKVTKYIENSMLAMESVKGPFPMTVNYSIEPLEMKDHENGEEEGPHCTVRIHIRGESRGYFMFIDRLLALMVSHNIKGDLRTLKEILEGEHESG